MKRSQILAIIVALVVLVSLGLYLLTKNNDETMSTNQQQGTTQSAGSDAQTEEQQEPTNDISAEAKSIAISDFSYSPQTITVKKGTTVTWTNNDSVSHDVAPDESNSEAFQKSELLAQGETYSFTFNTPGTYAYHCTPHPQMTGTVIVTD